LIVYFTTQGDLDNGSYTNTATATGTPSGGNLSPVSDSFTITAIQTPDWTITKSTSTADYSAVGDVINYEIQVANTGNVSISNVVLTDPKATGGITLTAGDNAPTDVLDVGETWIYTASHTVTQADIDAGSYSNTATVAGTDPSGNLTSPLTSSTITVDADQNPSWTLVKSTGTGGQTTYSQAGEVIPFEAVLTNTGNVEISGIQLDDPSAADITLDPNVGSP
ncbi:hypothetical protein ACFOSV_17195, partial [Algoriphagus namhaensis]